MSFLKSFVLSSRGCSNSEFASAVDPVVVDHRSMVLETQQLPGSGIERMWIEDSLNSRFHGLDNLHKKPLVAMKSLLMWKGDGGDVDLWSPEGNEKFYQLEHLGGIDFSTLAHLPALKYVQGTCVDYMVNYFSN